jgi:DNA-binding response OmpR family regulator
MRVERSLRVLIVEDEALLADELDYIVRRCGGETVGHAMTSGEAVRMAETLGPNLALVDVHLRDGPTGPKAARTMADHSGPLVLFLTANLKRLPQDMAGACGAMSKPFSEHAVRSALMFLHDCMAEGHARREPPNGLVLSTEFARRWGVEQSASARYALREMRA